jgi:phage tail protein X
VLVIEVVTEAVIADIGELSDKAYDASARRASVAEAIYRAGPHLAIMRQIPPVSANVIASF